LAINRTFARKPLDIDTESFILIQRIKNLQYEFEERKNVTFSRFLQQ